MLKTSKTPILNDTDDEEDGFPISNMEDYNSLNTKLQDKNSRKRLVSAFKQTNILFYCWEVISIIVSHF